MPKESGVSGGAVASSDELPFTPAELAEIEAEARAGLEAAAGLGALAEAERQALGKRSRFSLLYQQLGRLSPERRKEAGQRLHQLRRRLEDLVEERRHLLLEAERLARLEADRLDLTEVLPGELAGHLHLVTLVTERLEDVFVGMGYEIAEGPELETDWYNFQALNIGIDHPARAATDTFFVDVEGEDGADYLLRTHTSPVQVHLLERGRLPIYAVAPGLVYRRDTADATHLAGFHQIEGLAVDHCITMGDLAGTIESFVHALFGSEVSTRLRPGYFPFTEPSAEFEISCQICGGEGCRTCSMTGWIELGGCGMVHPNVLLATGVDPEEWSGFAFGFGVDRLATMRHGIADLRSFVENDIRFLSQF
jgi:phenylalanyl-tRNA synthetase alpha chain